MKLEEIAYGETAFLLACLQFLLDCVNKEKASLADTFSVLVVMPITKVLPMYHKQNVKGYVAKTLGINTRKLPSAKGFSAAKNKQGGGCNNIPQNRDNECLPSSPVNGLSVRCDYLQGLGVVDNIQMLLRFVGDLADWETVERPSSVCCYDFTHRAQLLQGATVKWVAKDGGYFYHLTLTGKYWSKLRLLDQLRKFNGLHHAFKMRSTRFDIALDDCKRRVKPSTIMRWIEGGHVARFRKYKYIKSGMAGTKGAATIYMGSDKDFTRFYDAEEMHGIDADRWERQMRERKADEYFKVFVDERMPWHMSNLPVEEREQKLAKALAGCVVGAVDFRKKAEGVNHIDRRKQAKWWQQLCEEIGQVNIVHMPVEKPTWDKTVAWLERQVSVRLAVAQCGMGRQGFAKFINGMIDKAVPRFRQFDIMMVHEVESLYENAYIGNEPEYANKRLPNVAWQNLLSCYNAHMLKAIVQAMCADGNYSMDA